VPNLLFGDIAAICRPLLKKVLGLWAARHLIFLQFKDSGPGQLFPFKSFGSQSFPDRFETFL